MADHPVTRYEEDFLIHNPHFQGQMRTKTTKSPTDLFWKQSYLKQHQHQGKFAWLKKNKQEIQSLKINLYYTTLPFEPFDSFMTAPKHKATQLHWLPFPWSPAVLYSDNTQIQSTTELHTTHKVSQKEESHTTPPCVMLSEGASYQARKCIKLSRHIIAWLRLSQLRIHSHWQVSLASNFSVTNTHIIFSFFQV